MMVWLRTLHFLVAGFTCFGLASSTLDCREVMTFFLFLHLDDLSSRLMDALTACCPGGLSAFLDSCFHLSFLITTWMSCLSLFSGLTWT